MPIVILALCNNCICNVERAKKSTPFVDCLWLKKFVKFLPLCYGDGTEIKFEMLVVLYNTPT